MRHPTTWPAQLHPLVDAGEGALTPDTSRTVEAFQLRADLLRAALAWTGGQLDISRGTPAVLLPGAAGRIELGDYAVRVGGVLHAEPAAGFWTRWWPAADIGADDG